MKQTINFRNFEKAFISFKRENHFPKGLKNLFEYLEEYERDLGEELELDVIAICCDFVEDEIKNALEEHDFRSVEELREHTQVIEVDEETIIYQVF